MKSDVHVALRPAKPLVIYDGDCRFCCFWVRRWQRATRDQVDYLPFQDPVLAERFPEVPRQQLESAVHLIETDGTVSGGAEAAFGALAHGPDRHWYLDWYEHSPGFAFISESAYRFIARHRTVFSKLTRLAWGPQIDPPEYQLVRWLFLRSLGMIYLFAFVSLGTQIRGLIGLNGILPAKLTMDFIRQSSGTAEIGLNQYHLFPTLCWFSTSDGFLRAQCVAGAVLALVLMIGLAPAACLFLLWLLYLSLTVIGNEFLGFQWDALLLETGFLAIFLAPLQLLPRLNRAPPPSRLALWLLRWLLFRLMFESGCVKLLSGDLTWRNLTALRVHYETQPLPTWIAWYAHQLPLWAQKASTALMFGIELFVPFLIFLPRRLRHFGCVSLIALQVLIFLTGNYCFFNLLTIALCLLVLEDSALRRFFPARWWAAYNPDPLVKSGRALRWPVQLTMPLFCIVMMISLIQFALMFHVRLPWPRTMVAGYEWLARLRTFNSYGLFAVMTTTRPEIIVQGSADGAIWYDYEFKYKPGDVKRRPRFVAPHQPRLDWQMWFAALGNHQQNQWFVNFCVRLLQGAPEVTSLLANNPFPDAPPRYVRAVVYEYHFTDRATRKNTGTWWRREFKGLYLPPVSQQASRTD